MDVALIVSMRYAIGSSLRVEHFDDVADDAAQDYILDVLRKPRRSRNERLSGARAIFAAGRVPRWLRGELKSRAMKLRKKAERYRGESLDAEDARISLASIAFARRREQEQAWIEELRSMPKHREIVDAILDGGCQTKQEVADRLGVTARTVYNWVSD